MRRADRLFQIVQLLRGGRLTTAARLAETLEVSERTIYRDIADLIGSGVPVAGEAGVGYVMEEGFDLPPLMFNTDEIIALVAGARLIRAWGGSSMAKAAEEALEKIHAVLPEEARRRARAVNVHAMAPPHMDEEFRDRLDLIEQAADRRLRLTFQYEDQAGAASFRTVRPLGLWFWGQVWTLVSWCELRDGFRMFRVDRVAELTVGERFPAERDKSLSTFYIEEHYRRRQPGEQR